MVESLTKVLKVYQRALPDDESAYMGIYFAGESCPKSPRRMMEQPPKGIEHWEGKEHVNKHQYQLTNLGQSIHIGAYANHMKQ